MPPPPPCLATFPQTNITVLLVTANVFAETQTNVIEAAFQEFTEDRKDIAILLINQHVRH